MTWLWIMAAVLTFIAGFNLYAFVLVIPARPVTLLWFNMAIAIVLATFGGCLYFLSRAFN